MFFYLFSKYYDLSTRYRRLKNIDIIYPKTENSQKSRHNGQKRAFRYWNRPYLLSLPDSRYRLE